MLKQTPYIRQWLRPSKPSDLNTLYVRAYNNQEFMQLFKLNTTQDKAQLKKQLEERHQQAFEQRSYKEYVIEHEEYGVIGLAALADHNQYHNSAEILIGLFQQQHRGSHLALTATLQLLDIAFNQLGLNRLNSYVYGHNQFACQCTEKLGFSAEGLRKDYIYSQQSDSYIDVFCFGLRGIDFRANFKLKQLSQRLLKKDITQMPRAEISRANVFKTNVLKANILNANVPKAKMRKHNKAALVAASAVCSKLALAPAYGKTSSSSSSTDTSAAISPSDGKTAAQSGNSSSGSGSSSSGSEFIQVSCTDNVSASIQESIDLLDPLIYLDSFYVRANPDLSDALGNHFTYEDARQHWLEYGLAEGRVASPAFQVKVYLQLNPDLQDSFLNENGEIDYVAAANHWLSTGIHQGRQASSVFDVQYYLSANPDVYKYFGTDFAQATTHWVNKGITEDRQFSDSFDVNYYLEKNHDVKNAFGENRAEAVSHWLLRGQNEDRPSAGESEDRENVVDCSKVGSRDFIYSPGDQVKHAITIKVTEDKFNSQTEYRGLATYEYSTTNVENPDSARTLKLTETQRLNYPDGSAAVNSSNKKYVFFDLEGNYRHYKDEQMECLNTDICNEGILIWKHSMQVGDSWDYQLNYTGDDGAIFRYQANYQVVGEEILSLPVGDLQTYKVEYSIEQNEACLTFDCSNSDLASSKKVGTYWYKDGLGPVKQDYVDTKRISGVTTTTTAISKIFSTNKTIP